MASAERTEILEMAYADLVSERDRLRDARGGFTGRLGPLPASAAIVIGLAGSAADDVNKLWVVEAALLLALLMFISTVYSGLRPYRLLRARRQAHFDPALAEDGKELVFGLQAPDRATWLQQKIKLEQELCGSLQLGQPFFLSLQVDNLQEALNVERSAVALVQILFAEIVFVLVIGIVMNGSDRWVQASAAVVIGVATVGVLAYARREWGFLEGWSSRGQRSERKPEAGRPRA